MPKNLIALREARLVKHPAPMRHPVILVLLVACGSIEQPPEVEPIFGPPLDDREVQGTTILGGLDTVGMIGAETAPYYVGLEALVGTEPLGVTVVDGQLVVGGELYNASPSDFDGMTLTGFDGRKLAVTEALPAASGERIQARYRLDLEGVDPCNGEYAIPVSGTYSVDARYQSAAAITFSCEKGEVYKCHNFGYPAGDPATTKGQLHQACVYMAGARYCSDRRSFTREGTQIAMFDRPGARLKFPPDWTGMPRPATPWTPWVLSAWPSQYDEFWIEAAWRADGTALCLARSRWASLEEDPCDGALPDPRVVPGANYCEDLFGEGMVTPPEAWIVNTSRVNDARFDMWRASSGDLFATSRGFKDDDASVPMETKPFGAAGMTYVGEVGILLRVPTQEMLPDVVQVNTYCKTNSNDCVVSTTPPPMHPNNRGAEGYLFTKKQPNTAELWLWKNAANDYVSAITKPGILFSKVAGPALGWIFRPN